MYKLLYLLLVLNVKAAISVYPDSQSPYININDYSCNSFGAFYKFDTTAFTLISVYGGDGLGDFGIQVQYVFNGSAIVTQYNPYGQTDVLKDTNTTAVVADGWHYVYMELSTITHNGRIMVDGVQYGTLPLLGPGGVGYNNVVYANAYLAPTIEEPFMTSSFDMTTNICKKIWDAKQVGYALNFISSFATLYVFDLNEKSPDEALNHEDSIYSFGPRTTVNRKSVTVSVGASSPVYRAYEYLRYP